MALHSNILIDLIRMVSQLGTDDWIEGTATGGDTTYLDDTSRNEADDYFNSTVPRSRIRIIETTDSAAPMGEEKEISDWVNSNGRATFASAMTVAPEAGDTYVILHEFSWTEIKQAINSAIDLFANKVLVETEDESISLVSDVYEYPAPSGFLYIYQISMADSSGAFPQPIPNEDWRIVRGTSTPRIHLRRFPTQGQPADHYYTGAWADTYLTAGRALRVEGLKRQARLDEDVDICYIDPNLIWRQAAAILHSKKIRRAENEPDDHRSQYQVHQTEASRILSDVETRLPLGSRRCY